MTAIPQPVSARAITDRLSAPLREVARRHWFVLAAVGVFKTLIVGLVALLAAALLLGYFQNLWVPVRVLLAVVAWVLVIGSAIWFLRPALGRWSLSRAAMQVEQDRPGLQERLSSAIELAGEPDPTFRGSPGLIAHLFRQAEADAGAVRPGQIVPTDRVVRWALLFVPVLLAWMIVALMPSTTKTAMAGLYRVLMPWKDALPALLTQVAVKPGEITLVQGDSLDVTAHVSFDSGNDRNVRHATLIRKFETGQAITDDMEQAGAHDYRLRLEDVQQTFSYMVSTDQGDSQWFKATVHPRPQISSVEVRCDYPAYTGMSSTVVSGRDGAIEALVGTRVTLTIHTALPVVAEKSRIAIDEGTPDQLILPLKQLEANKPDYQAQLIVNHSGEYRINLANEFDLTNKDEQPRSIVAQPDEVPTIVIRSPEARVTVGADDIVPVRYIANDDFAVAKIEALVQVDDRPVQTVPVAFKTTDKRTVTGPPYIISVADVLKSQNVTNAEQITYQLKVTDNRDPDPQFSFSNKQTLKINRGEYQTFQAKEDRKIAENLTRAIQKAINELNQEQQHVQPAKDIDARQRLEEWNRKELHEAAQELPKTSRDLAKAAADAKDSVFEDIAKQVQKIATKPIRSAAENATQADLNADNGQDRKDAADRAVAEITQARDALQKILDKQEIDKTQRQAEAARDLADAAKKQEEAAELMKSPQQVAQQQQQPNHQAQQQQQEQQRQAMHKQEQANQKLQQALQQSEPLRDPQAQETAQKLADLIRKVEDLEKKQDATSEQTEKQQAAAEVQQAANDLAQKQEALNQEIQKSAEQNKDALQKANANPPSKDQQQNIVKALNQNNIQQAHEQMKQAANQLHQEAQQLNNQAKANDLHANPQQQDALNKDQQAADQAQNEKNAAQQAANNLKQEAAQHDVKPNADDQAVANARQAAKEIQKEAADLHPKNDDAQQAAQAARQDAQAAEKAADQAAGAANPQDAQKDLNDAAKDLNKAGQELADASKENADADKGEMVKAQQKDAQAAAEQADQQAKEQDALAQGLEAREKALAKVQNLQQPDQSAQQQHEIADQARDAQQQAEQLQHQAEQAKNPNVETRAEQAKADLTEAQQHAAEAAKAEQQAAAAQQAAANADNAQKADAAEQNANRALEQAANDQRQAQDALAKAESELRNLPTQEANADAQKPADANAQADAAQQQPGDQNAKAEQRQAAQAAQEAAQAQQEASQQNPAAAQEAAKALAQAAQALAQATPGLQPGQPDNGQEPGDEPGQDPSTTPGHTPDSKQGISASSAPISLPASVRDIGITADQWAILPPLVKKDLMNAAQQSGPPAYRQMIKDYYVRVAKIQQAGSPVGQ